MREKEKQLINIPELEKIKKTIIKHSPYKKALPKIIAVTKTHSIETVKAAINNNLTLIGENKVQEAEKKFLENKKIKENIRLHLIGHLQSNKTKKAVKIFDVIQTVDSKKILKKINLQAEKINKKQEIYLQVNIGKDKQKRGFSVLELLSACSEIHQYQSVFLSGIMTILPFGKSKSENKKLYKKTKELQKKIQKDFAPLCKNTSMGMSGDYAEAVESGATHIRIGSALFGKRN